MSFRNKIYKYNYEQVKGWDNEPELNDALVRNRLVLVLFNRMYSLAKLTKMNHKQNASFDHVLRITTMAFMAGSLTVSYKDG